jgi:hypothetical protein
MKRDKFQSIVAISYEKGEFSHIGRDGNDLSDAVLLASGDGLFRYLMVELSENEDCDNYETAIRRLNTSIRQLEEVKKAFEWAQDRTKKYNHAYSLGFAINSNNEDDNVTKAEMIKGLRKRLEAFESGEEDILECCDSAFDTYENEEV